MDSVQLTGEVTRFKGTGRQLGYPTANLTATTDLKDGVYFGYADMAGFQSHPAMIFIGIPVTVGDTGHRIEAHLFDIPDVDYYGQHLNLIIRHFHRANLAFTSVDELMAAIKADEAAARAWFANPGNQVETTVS